MKATILVLIMLALLIAGCTPSIVIRPGTPDALYVASQVVNKTPEMVPAGADRHFIQADDYFLTDEPFEDAEFLYASIGKMQTPPSETTKHQGQFLRVQDGKIVWTRYFAKTRIATPADLVVGKVVYYFDSQDANGSQRTPESNQESRTTWWIKTRITDTSELYRNLVLVASGSKVNKDALRVDLP